MSNKWTVIISVAIGLFLYASYRAAKAAASAAVSLTKAAPKLAIGAIAPSIIQPPIQRLLDRTGVVSGEAKTSVARDLTNRFLNRLGVTGINPNAGF